MDPTTWKIFVDAAEFGSLSKVAMAHGTSQPQISRLIGELEHECGGRLFRRTGRGVLLTELGERIAPRIRAWIASTDELANDIRTAAGTPIGNVRIGSIPSTAYPLLTTVFARLRQQFPLVQMAVREGQGAQLETWLEDGSVDIAILFRMSPIPRNGDVYLFEAPTYLVSAKGDPLTAKPTIDFAALDNLPLVQFCRPSAWRNHLEQVAVEQHISLNVALEAELAQHANQYRRWWRHVCAARPACRRGRVADASPAIIATRRADGEPLCRACDVAAWQIDTRVSNRDADDPGGGEVGRSGVTRPGCPALCTMITDAHRCRFFRPAYGLTFSRSVMRIGVPGRSNASRRPLVR